MGTYRKEACTRLVAVHGDGGSVIKGVQNFFSERVPLELRILLRHTNVPTHTLVLTVEPGGKSKREGERWPIKVGGGGRLGKIINNK